MLCVAIAILFPMRHISIINICPSNASIHRKLHDDGIMMITELCGSLCMGINTKELLTKCTSQVAEIPMNAL